jgi:hypothetical protein
MTFGIVRWWVQNPQADQPTESALASRLHELNVDFVHWLPATLKLTFPGTRDDAQLAFQALRAWLRTTWKPIVRQQFASDFRVLIVATIDNAVGDL